MFFTQLEYGLAKTILLVATYGISITFSTGLVRYISRQLPARSCVMFGEVIKLFGISLILIGTMHNNVNVFIPFVGQILGGFGFCLCLSTDIGLLTESGDELSKDAFSQVQSRSQSLMFAATLCSGLLGAILYNYQEHWPFMATLLTNIVAFLVVASFPSIHSKKTNNNNNYQQDVFILDSTERFWILYYVIGRIATLAPFLAFLPLFFMQLQPDHYTFGIVLSLFSLTAFISAFYSNQLDKSLGSERFYWLNVTTMLVGMGLFTLCEWFAELYKDPFPVACVAILLMGFGSGCIRPLAVNKLLLGEKAPQERTFILSTMEKQFGICNALVLMVGGGLIYVGNFSTVMLFLTIIYFITAIFRDNAYNSNG